MAHKFPRHRFQSGWPMDVEEIDENLRIVAEELEGKLNEHNFKAGTFSARTDLAAGAIIDVNNTSTTVNPSLDGADGSLPLNYPGLAVPPADQFTVSANGEWQVVVTQSKFTANSLLWVLGNCQVQLYDNVPGDPVDTDGLQVALRLDGIVIEETIVGGMDRSNDGRGEAIKMQAGSVVTDMVIPVEPGRHIIELVARLARDYDMGQPPATEYATVGTRELIVITGDPHQSVVSGNGASWVPLQEGDTVTAFTVEAPLNALVAEANALDFPAVQPESLHAAHLTGAVVEADYTSSSGLTNYTNRYPGFDVDTAGVSPGWAVVLALTFAPVDMTDATIAGVLVLANTNITTLDDTSGGINSELVYAVTCIQVQSGGTWRTVAKTERYTNSETDATLGQLVCRKNHPTRTFIRQADLDGGTNLTGIRLMVCAQSREGFANNVSVTLENSDLSYAVLQAGG